MKKILFITVFSLTSIINAFDLKDIYLNTKISTTQCIVSSNKANIYSEPDFNSKIINVKNLGDVISISEILHREQKDNYTLDYWYEVKNDNSSGYIYGNDLHSYNNESVIVMNKTGKILFRKSKKVMYYNSLITSVITRLKNDHVNKKNIDFQNVKVISDDLILVSNLNAPTIPTGHSIVRSSKFVNSSNKIIVENDKVIDFKFSNKLNYIIIQEIKEFLEPGTEYSNEVKIYDIEGNIIKSFNIKNDFKIKDFMFQFERLELSEEENIYCWVNNSSIFTIFLDTLKSTQKYFTSLDNTRSTMFNDLIISKKNVVIDLKQPSETGPPQNIKIRYNIVDNSLIIED